jgi:Alpha-L-arabinofuranosidase B, catalytic
MVCSKLIKVRIILSFTFIFLFKSLDLFSQNTLDRVGLTSSSPASAAFSTRLLSSTYTGTAMRVRRSSDNTETDIGFTSFGELDQTALLNFVKEPTTTVQFPLDVIAASSAAFSLRKLRSAYTGYAIKVRRSSDNVEQDIGFDANGNLNQTELLAHVGSGSGFVTIWYDQSGNGVNITQATAANQPRIVLNGVVDNINGKPSLVSTNATSFLEGTLDVNGLTGMTLNAVGRNPNTLSAVDNRAAFFSWTEAVSTLGKVYLTNNQTEIGWRFGTGQSSNRLSVPATISSDLGVFTVLKNGSTETPYLNGTAFNSNRSALPTTANNGTNFKLFASDNGTSQAGLYQSEAIIFRTALSDGNRTALEINQLYYYLSQFSGFVTRWYDQSGNNKHVLNTSSASQPRIVNNGQIQLLTGKPALFFPNNIVHLSSVPATITARALSIIRSSVFSGFSTVFATPANNVYSLRQYGGG